MSDSSRPLAPEPKRGKRGLLGPTDIRSLSLELDVAPTKRLGQNFVHDSGTVRKIAALAELRPSDTVLEIGPGLGSLTLALLETGASVTAIEIDPRLAARLPRTIAEFDEAWAPRFTVQNLDALFLRTDHAGHPTAMVANLPYNVSVPVLLHTLATFPSITRVVVMVQKEVAERLAAGPGSRTYGAPSVKLAWYGHGRLAGTIGRKVFWPEPNVDSALVQVAIDHPTRGSEDLRAATFQIVDGAFGQRRKMLRSSLRPLMGSEQAVTELLRRAKVDGAARPESLGIDQFVSMGAAKLSLPEALASDEAPGPSGAELHGAQPGPGQ